MLSDTPLEYAESLFNKILDKNKDTAKISVIDPYVIPSDMYTLASFFGGFSSITLEIISKFETVSAEENKEERKEKLKTISGHLSKNGLFKEVSYCHSTEKMHDRYYIFWKDNNDKIIISIGGSVAQNFLTHTNIIEIKDKYLELCIAKYYFLLTEKKC
ncbi:hypothetical protein [uncultured Thiothrix sp.]|jgi:hypothetical protein|uniref:hypothetical protein n=1 Tax=uncultured Thiothrix sp. TaxID=223185 RepID=UPI002607B7BB|nr:hypothetical protein [uncultured Thiothrix sp.]HMT94160.1 hypothetical protein [Thiolinea sp.]